MSQPTPFGGGPLDDLMRNLARLLTTQGPVNWEIAGQMASFASTGGRSEANPDPLARVRLEELLRVADLQVTEATGLATSSAGILSVRAVTRSQWAQQALDDWRPLLERLATSLTAAGPDGEASSAGPGPDPLSGLLGNLPQVLGPLLFGMQVGAMVGDLATRAMGQYDYAVPRPPAAEVVLVPSTIEGWASDWSLSPDDVRLWVCLREVTFRTVLGRPHVHARLDALLGAYVGAFRPDAGALEDRLAGFDPTDPSNLQQMFGDPEYLLGELQTDEQRRLQVPLHAVLSVVSGYVDHVMDTVGRRLISSYGPLTEAMRRRRIEEGQGVRILGKLLGAGLGEAAYARGQAFVHGVLERAGEEGLGRLWVSEAELPTPAEVEAPGLWLARIDLPG
ncbi:MAG: zinc-dependent metalloprotease [Acidimicrobiales bacterium]